jgi:hypothetical protein
VRKSKNKGGVGGGGDEECVPHVADGEAEFVVRNRIRDPALTPTLSHGERESLALAPKV